MLKIEMLGGNCPVQADGTICGTPFYFRARGEHWSLNIGKDPVGDPDFRIVERWGNGPYAAGWMPEETARRIIEACADIYAAWTRDKPSKPEETTP